MLNTGNLTDTSEIVNTGYVRICVGEQFVITERQGTVGELSSVRADLEGRTRPRFGTFANGVGGSPSQCEVPRSTGTFVPAWYG